MSTRIRKGRVKVIKLGDSFFQINYTQKSFITNRSTVSFYTKCGDDYINNGKVFSGTINECKKFIYDNISHFEEPEKHFNGDFLTLQRVS